jgi:hypothetical protein
MQNAKNSYLALKILKHNTDINPPQDMFKKIREIHSFIQQDSRIKPLIWLFFIFSFFVIVATFLYAKIPLLINYSLWGEENFYFGLITNMHSSAIDFLVFSIGIYFVMLNHDKRVKIKQFHENIDDTRFWFSEEAAFRNFANIRRLQELGIKSIDFSKCSLVKTKLKELEFINSKAMGAVLDSANFEKSKFIKTSFRGAFARETSFYNTHIEDCCMDYLKLQNGTMKSSHIENVSFKRAELDGADFHSTQFKNCSFKEASLKECNMERADLRNCMELTIEQLLTCKSLKYTRLDSHLEKQIFEKNPNLLGRKSSTTNYQHKNNV